jgi:hypothetical protein
MRFVHLYLLGYFLSSIGAGLALWQAGILARISTNWLMIAAIIVVGLGTCSRLPRREPHDHEGVTLPPLARLVVLC